MKAYFRIIVVLLFITNIFPFAYFTYRASQPMTMPEFKGLTWIQLMEWRYWEYARLEMEQMASHPESVKIFGKQAYQRTNLCFVVDASLAAFVIPAQSIIYTAVGLRGVKPDAGHVVPTQVTYTNLTKKWWSTIEHIQWYNAKISQNTPVIYCRIHHASMPSAEQFDAALEKTKMRVAELEEINNKRNALRVSK